jgi:hypothetical protein
VTRGANEYRWVLARVEPVRNDPDHIVKSQRFELRRRILRGERTLLPNLPDWTSFAF